MKTAPDVTLIKLNECECQTCLTTELNLCLITHESGASLDQTSSRLESVLTVGFAFTAGLVYNKAVGFSKLVSDLL